MFVNSVLFCLLSFSKATAEFDSAANKSLEKRLHNIYVSHYNRPVLDSDWFKVLESVEVQKHTVQAGDTLWGISKVYFGDGNYWSKLWSVNKGITNPHLIFVGDVISFSTGSFDSTPGIDIDKVGGGSAAAGSTEAAVESSAAVVVDTTVDRPLVPIPDFFETTLVVEKSEEAPIIFIPRPKLVYKSETTLTKDILEQPAEIVGKIKSLGQFRMITAEGTLIMLEADTELAIDSLYSVLKKNPPKTKSGYPISVQGVVKIIRKIDNGGLYEGKVVNQYGAFETGDPLSTYRPVIINADVTASTGIEVPIKILDDQRSLWSPGDTVFMETVDGGTVNVGDVLKINNKYVDNIEFYITNGYVKIVSVHAPYATGVIVNSREHIRPNSVSTPTYTGWGIW